VLGEEDMPTNRLGSDSRYIYKVTTKSIEFVNADKKRGYG